MVKHDIVERKLSQIKKSLHKIAGYRELSCDEFIAHPVARDVVEYNLFIIINSMIDIASHIVTDDKLGEVDVLSDGFVILAECGYWSKEQAKVFVTMVAFRNMLSHQYAAVNPDVVYDILQNKLGDIDLFVGRILDSM